MKIEGLLFVIVIAALMIFSTVLMGCGDDDDDDDDTDDADDDDADDDSDDDADDDSDGWPGDQKINVITPDGEMEVSLNGLPFGDCVDADPDDGGTFPGVLVSDVVDQALGTKDFDVADYKFNFVASDGYDPLGRKMDGDFRTLPDYDQLSMGCIIEYEEEEEKYTDLKIIWDESLGFPTYMRARLMDGGAVEMVENILFDQDVTVTVEFEGGAPTADVNLNGLPAFWDGDQLAVFAHHIVLEAALETFDPKTYYYAINYIGNDDYSLLEHIEGLGDDVMDLPWWDDNEDKNIHNMWLKDAGDDGYKVFWEGELFPNSYGAKLMNDGTIEIHDITDLVE